jgi:multidrug efflux system membrane fusion protein
LSKARLPTAGIIAVCCVAGASSLFELPSTFARQAGRGGAVNSPIPVSVAVVTRKDVPIYLSGLGTVQASLTVAIQPQVEGKLEEVLFTEGQQVKKGDVLARIEPRLFLAALNQAKAKKAQDEALLIAAEKDLNRIVALGARNIVSRQEVEQQQAKFDQLKASIRADDAAIDSAQTQLDYTIIRAPASGRVGIRQIDPGNVLHLSNATSNAPPITTLVVTRPSAVIFTLPANNLNEVRTAISQGPVEVTAFDQENALVLSKGSLLLIDNSIDAATGTIRLKAMFGNNDDRLWPGEFVNARVLVAMERKALTIPNAAVQRGPKGVFAWVVSANRIAQQRPIRVKATTGDLALIDDGLTEGDIVVTEGQYKLQANALIEVTPATPSASEQAK